MHSCLICDTPYEPFLSFGRQPIANGFLTPNQFRDEYFYDLRVGCCPSCKMVQLAEFVDRERMFHDHYAFFSSTSARMAEHFREFAHVVMADYLGPPDPFVVEIGSNDGIMLQHFAAKGIRHLGVEPSENVAAAARAKGVHTISRFFELDTACDIEREYGKADAILGANVMCHIPYLHSVLKGVKSLLKPKGVLIFEDPYLGDIVEKTSYDQIYDEHAFYFSLTSLSELFRKHDMDVVDVQAQPVHGGSMRYTVAHRGARTPAAAVAKLRAREEALGLGKAATYDQLRRNIERSRDDLIALLRDLKAKGKRVVGYAATSKSTTITNYCGITPDLVEFISDTTPIKQGKFSPGVHIPVRPYSEFRARYPDYALLFGWNHAEEILAKEQKFLAAGGKFITYVPKVGIIP